MLLSGGVNFAELSHQQAYQFQKDLLLVMMRIEDTFFNLAESEAKKGRKVLVICDRGAMDASACRFFIMQIHGQIFKIHCRH